MKYSDLSSILRHNKQKQRMVPVKGSVACMCLSDMASIMTPILQEGLDLYFRRACVCVSHCVEEERVYPLCLCICSYLFTALDKTSGTGYLTLPSVSALLHNEGLLGKLHICPV